jgi:hypothetical protein
MVILIHTLINTNYLIFFLFTYCYLIIHYTLSIYYLFLYIFGIAQVRLNYN